MLVSSLNPSPYGHAVTFTPNLTGQSGLIVTGGTVTFMDGTTTLGTVAVSGGAAGITTLKLASGTHTITATYSGTANYSHCASRKFAKVRADAKYTSRRTLSMLIPLVALLVSLRSLVLSLAKT